MECDVDQTLVLRPDSRWRLPTSLEAVHRLRGAPVPQARILQRRSTLDSTLSHLTPQLSNMKLTTILALAATALAGETINNEVCACPWHLQAPCSSMYLHTYGR